MSLTTNEKHESLEKFRAINEELQGKVETLETSVGGCIDIISNKIEYDQLNFFGKNITYDFISGLFSTLSMIVIGVI